MTLCIAQKPRKPDIFCWACAVTIEIENRRGGVRFEESNILNIYIKWGREERRVGWVGEGEEAAM